MDAEHYTSLDDISQSEPLPLDLYHIDNHPSIVGAGSLKSYEAKEGGGAVFARQKSGHATTVERLLWVDGWEETTVETTIDGEKTVHGQEMTLVVLKAVLASNDPKRKFARAEMTVSFKDPKAEGANEPRVVAWAPFHTRERWNASQARRTKSGKKDGRVSLGYSGSEASGGWSRERTISWDRVAFDQGYAHPHISSTTQHRNGVTWSLEQNNLQKAGVSPELWVAVLLSRPTAEPYLVKFRIDACVGSMEDFANKTKKFFGVNPDKTKPFLVTLWKSEVCNYEGKAIKECIDVNNLGKLVDKTQLNVRWGPDHQLEVPMPSASQQAWAKLKMAKAETEAETEGLTNNKAAEENALPTPFPTASPAASTQEPDLVSVPLFADAPSPAPGPPPLVIGWQNAFPHSPTTNVDSTRVTELESRMAQLEARLAGQDVLILQLQRALLNQEA
ncbi:hypothetical protein MKX08_008153 [Trichoderma sp. CBMAI-0020]|nr:hypothetical protein MKX08_008153 [Trichoderma sp. CBMAI-0020]